MGAADAQEMLDACKAQGIQDERQIAQLQRKLDAIRAVCDEAMSMTLHQGAARLFGQIQTIIRKDTP